MPNERERETRPSISSSVSRHIKKWLETIDFYLPCSITRKNSSSFSGTLDYVAFTNTIIDTSIWSDCIKNNWQAMQSMTSGRPFFVCLDPCMFDVFPPRDCFFPFFVCHVHVCLAGLSEMVGAEWKGRSEVARLEKVLARADVLR